MSTVINPQGIAEARPSPLNLLPFRIFLLSRMLALTNESAKPATPVNILKNDYCAIIGLNQKDLENQGILA